MAAVIDWNGIRAECRNGVWTCPDELTLSALELFANPEKVSTMHGDIDLGAAERAVETFTDVYIIYSDPITDIRDPNVVY